MSIISNKVDLLSLDGRIINKISVPEDFLNIHISKDLLNRYVYWTLNKNRSGTHHTKNVSEISGTGRKFRQQKKTGNARHGARRVNIFVGGAKAFSPRFRDHATELNKKEMAIALAMAIVYCLRTNMMFIIDSFQDVESQTKSWREKAKPWQNVHCLIVAEEDEGKNVFLATRNIPNCNFLVSNGINVYDLLRHKVILVTEKSFYNILKRFGYEKV